MTEPKASSPAEEVRKALLVASSAEREVRVVRFTNDDVPRFLKDLDEFEKASEERDIVVK